MKPHERRKQGNYPYYKIARWDERSMTFRDGKQAFPDKDSALASLPMGMPARYRLSVVTDEGRTDLEPFDVGAMVGGD